MIEETIRHGRTMCIFMHNDVIIPEGACEKLLDFVRDLDQQTKRWGVVFTNYDSLAAFNPQAYLDIGPWDRLLWYYGDNDFYRRLKLAGWTHHQAPIEVGHLGSQTIRSDPYLNHINAVTFPLHGAYYRAKWGGDPGEETFVHPFGILPREWELARQAR
jgi:hypothetical protein